MALFQHTVIKKHLESLDKNSIEQKWQKFCSIFHNAEKQKNIRNSKEEQYQEGFLRDLFVGVLGYTINPEVNFNLLTEQKNLNNSKKADGAILIDNKPIAVIELKGTETTDLNKIEAQAFGYKTNQPGCNYVITSNFEKLRFYIDNTTQQEEFNLFTLTKERFEYLYVCLAWENISKNVPTNLLNQSVSKENAITKHLYNDYSAFKRGLFDNLVELNPQHDKLELFKKTQKLLDRFLFIFFAEDRLLLPTNLIRRINKEWENLQKMRIPVSLYDRYITYFNDLNEGAKVSLPAFGKKTGDAIEETHDIFAYNGGLFKPDEFLDNLKIEDQLLFEHTHKLSDYDFQSEVDVNILGHIFENSLNEIDEIKSEIDGSSIDKAKTKRKKDGVFYTPKYITKYIVDNTVGKLCTEKKEEIKLLDEDYITDKKLQTKTKKALLDKLSAYRNWLLDLTICDPACGSGAFLNQALEFLIAEHSYIDELQAKLMGDAMVLSDIENSILERNIYGVDLNDESVEIAKLSLWLRTAQKGRKLNSLNNNIKCGNSLIDNVEVAGEKAFSWEKEFPDVFDPSTGSGAGFDVIIGNPPYVGEKGHSDIFESLKKIPKWNKFYRRRSNTYYFFIKHGIDLLKINGLQSLIIPREFTNADWANKVRQDIIENSKIIEVVDFNSNKIFEDAGTTSLILTHQKNKEKENNYNIKLKSISNNSTIQNNLFDELFFTTMPIKKLISEDYKPWNFNTFEIKLSNKIIPLGDVFDISQGLVTGADKVTNKHLVSGLISDEFLGRGIFILGLSKDIIIEDTKVSLNIFGNWINLNEEDKKFIKPYFKPENLNKWTTTTTSLYILYVGNNNLTQNIKDYLLQFDSILLNRSTINSDVQINLLDFQNFTLEEIKQKYSSAGSVQKIMRQKKWYLPLYERIHVPFDFDKIVVNTKNMNVFTYSNDSLYSSGGGAGGQNFIYINEKSKQFNKLSKHTSKAEFTMYVNAILNSKLIQFCIENGQFNQLSTSKISDLPLRIFDFNKSEELLKYQEILKICKTQINNSNQLVNDAQKFLNYLENIFSNVDKLKLQHLYSINFKDFVFELNKSNQLNNVGTLTKKDEFEWLDLFEENKQKAISIKAEIDKTDKEIDQMVYELYELTEEEIKIISDATS